MVTSFNNFKIQWKLVSTKQEVDFDTYEYEYDLPNQFQYRKYHMTKVVSPEGEHRSYSVS